MNQAIPITAASMDSRFSNPPTSLGTLRNLPPEIRNMIYAFVFSPVSPAESQTSTDHYTAILRVSKDLYLDSRRSMYRHSVYHISIKYWLDWNMYDLQAVIDEQPSSQGLAHIQDLDVRIEGCPSLSQEPNPLWGWAGEGGLSGLLKGLVKQMNQKRSCRIGFHHLLNPELGPELLEPLGALQCFDSVAIEFIHVDGDWDVLLRKKCLKLDEQIQGMLRPADGRGQGPVMTTRYRLQCLPGDLLEL